jgi:hypothetical protein
MSYKQKPKKPRQRAWASKSKDILCGCYLPSGFDLRKLPFARHLSEHPVNRLRRVHLAIVQEPVFLDELYDVTGSCFLESFKRLRNSVAMSPFGNVLRRASHGPIILLDFSKKEFIVSPHPRGPRFCAILRDEGISLCQSFPCRWVSRRRQALRASDRRPQNQKARKTWHK